MTQKNPFLDFLEDEPKAAYFGYQDQWRTPNQRKYFQSQFANIQNQYLGSLGKQIYGGGVPSLKFTDFLSQFPWMQQYQQSSEGMGQDTSRYNPWTRWML